MIALVAARVSWGDDFDNAPDLEILVEGERDYDAVYERWPSARRQLSDEQAAIVGGRAEDHVTPGWYVYVQRDGPLVSMFTWGGVPDQGFGGSRRIIDVVCGPCDGAGVAEPGAGMSDPCPVCQGQGQWPEEIRGGWHPSAETAKYAGVAAVSVSCFWDRGSWDRGHTATALFALEDEVRAQLLADQPEVMWQHGSPPRFYGQISKRAWRYLERQRIDAEVLAWEGEHGGPFDPIGGPGYPWLHAPWPSIRPYSMLGPVKLDAYGRCAGVRRLADLGVPREELDDYVIYNRKEG